MGTLTAEEEERMSAALIAKMLAEDAANNGYYDEDAEMDDYGDMDYGRGGYGRGNRKSNSNSGNGGSNGRSKGGRSNGKGRLRSDDSDDDYRPESNSNGNGNTTPKKTSAKRRKTNNNSAITTPARSQNKTRSNGNSANSDAITSPTAAVSSTSTAPPASITSPGDSAGSANSAPADIPASATPSNTGSDKASEAPSTTGEAEGGSASGLKVSKRIKGFSTLTPGTNGDFKTGAYTDDEEERFLEALELHGRDWDKVGKHIKTRDAKSIRSHAQKHFIKLFRDGLPLPAEVAKSGNGYTLSGAALDPYSAAARPYLSKMIATDKPLLERMLSSQPELPPEITSAALAETPANGEGGGGGEGEGDGKSQPKPAAVKPKHRPRIRVKNTEASVASAAAINNTDTASETDEDGGGGGTDSEEEERRRVSLYDSDGRTAYSRGRLRSASARVQTKSVFASSLRESIKSGAAEPHTLVQCTPFSGSVLNTSAGSQPFEMTVRSNVLVCMDFHSHLVTTEIIGLLAGSWCNNTRKLTIERAYPCRALQSLDGGDRHMNVEMDPVSELEVRQLIQSSNLSVVGWYHSHPTFVPNPSIVDLENQLNYQSLFHTANEDDDTDLTPVTTTTTTTTTTTAEPTASPDKASPDADLPTAVTTPSPSMVQPFVGAIVSPYDPALLGSVSAINWFCVTSTKQSSCNGGLANSSACELEDCIPRSINHTVINDSEMPTEIVDQLVTLAEDNRKSLDRVNFNAMWRPNISKERRLYKMIASLIFKMPWLKEAVEATAAAKPDKTPEPDSAAEVKLEEQDRATVATEANEVVKSDSVDEKLDTENTGVIDKPVVDEVLVKEEPVADEAAPSDEQDPKAEEVQSDDPVMNEPLFARTLAIISKWW